MVMSGMVVLLQLHPLDGEKLDLASSFWYLIYLDINHNDC